MYSLIECINMLLFILFTVFYSYQLFYALVAFFGKERRFVAKKQNRFAVIIAARNESAVIGNLIMSIRKQKYPEELVDVFVIADNCTDDTAEVSESAGATVFVRNDTKHVGKGYALNFGFNKLFASGDFDKYDGFFIFDADNLLDENYIAEMNNVFDSGYRIVTSYRNSKNYDTNWISAGSSLWFLREAKYINSARMTLGTSCAVSGTGFLVHKDIIRRNSGWNYYLLTEDIEFSVASILHGEKIGYASKAMFYDEQPYIFRESWNQRIRWAKGFYQIFAGYGGSLFKSIFKKGGFACYDMLMTIMPAMMISLLSVLVNLAFLIVGIFCSATYPNLIGMAGISIFFTIFNFYSILLFFGAITTASEWKQINAAKHKKILYTLTFPIFILTYIPLSIVALFRKIEWKPIEHNISKSIEEIQG